MVWGGIMSPLERLKMSDNDTLNDVDGLVKLAAKFDDYYLRQSARRLAKRLVNQMFPQQPSLPRKRWCRSKPEYLADFNENEIHYLNDGDFYAAVESVRERLGLTSADARSYVRRRLLS